MDTSKIQAFPQNVLVRKISLNRLKNLQKLSVYEKSVFKKRACASKITMDHSIFSRCCLSKLLERLFSKQLAEFFERILLMEMSCAFY